MLRGITKRHKHTHRRRTMRKKNRTMRRRHSSHLKHSRRNLHRRREGGAEKLGHFLAKGLGKVAKEYIKQKKIAEKRAEYERLGQEGELLRRQSLSHPRQTFSAQSSPPPRLTRLVPSTASVAPAAYAAPRQASTALPAGISKDKFYVPDGMVMVAPTRYFSSMGKKLSSRRDIFPSDTNHN
jgi:hypothetical protein